MARDKYGNYVNNEGVTIKITQDKNGKDHISFYDGPVDGNHSSVHVNVDYNDGGSWNTATHGENHSNTEHGSGGCFLTTACMMVQTEAFDDKCHELETLRWFRDHHVSQEDIDHYYCIAPSIVLLIDAQPNAAEIYQTIYQDVVSVCVEAIENQQFEQAYTTYKNAVVKLEQEYLNSSI